MEGSKLAAAILGEVRRAVVGKDEVLAKVLLAILAAVSIVLLAWVLWRMLRIVSRRRLHLDDE